MGLRKVDRKCTEVQLEVSRKRCDRFGTVGMVEGGAGWGQRAE